MKGGGGGGGGGGDGGVERGRDEVGWPLDCQTGKTCIRCADMPPREADKTAVKLKKKEDKAKRKIEKTPLSANAANHEIELEEIVLDNSVTEAENPEEHSPNSNGLSQVPRSNDSLSEDTPPADPQALYGVTPNAFWVATSASMLAITYLLIIALAGIVLWQFIVHEYEQHVIAWVIGAIFVMASVVLYTEFCEVLTLPAGSLGPAGHSFSHYTLCFAASTTLRADLVDDSNLRGGIMAGAPIQRAEDLSRDHARGEAEIETNRETRKTEIIEHAYESYVVYSFFKLMREFLGDKPRNSFLCPMLHLTSCLGAVARLKKVAEEKGRGKAIMLWPCCCMTAWRLDAQFLTRCSLGVWQVSVVDIKTKGGERVRQGKRECEEGCARGCQQSEIHMMSVTGNFDYVCCFQSHAQSGPRLLRYTANKSKPCTPILT
eukprot:757823-Hanusia_phi.AAC.7